MKQKGNAGFSLIALLCSFTIGAVFLVIFATAFKNMTRATGTLRTDLSFETLRHSLLVLFKNPTLCGKSFVTENDVPIQFPPKENAKIKIIVGGATIASLGYDLGNQSYIKKLFFKVVGNPTPTSSGGNQYVALLEFETNENRQRLGRQVLSTNPFLLAVTTSSTGQIETCGVQEDTGGGGGLQEVAEAFLVSNHRIPDGSRHTPELIVKKGTVDDFEMVAMKIRAGHHYTFYSGLKFHPPVNNPMFGLRCKTEKGWKYTSCSEATNGADGFVGDLWGIEGGCMSNDWNEGNLTGMEIRVICTR